MKLFEKITGGLSVAVLLAGSAFAGPINGSEGLSQTRTGPIFVSNDGGATYSATGDLITADHIEFTGLQVTASTGDFNFDTTTSFAGTYILDLTGGIGANNFTISDLGWGTFLAENMVLDSVAGNALTVGLTNTNALLTGFTPGPNQLAGTTSNTASLLITLNQSGGAGDAITGSLTLNTPASNLTGAPEPATMSLFGGALVGLGLLGRKRFARR
jgi:hypothetical protein